MTRRGVLRYAGGLLTLAFAALWLRLFHFQVLEHPRAVRRLEAMATTVERDVARRGRILSRGGYVLAESLPALDVYADSRWTAGRREEILERLDAIVPGHRDDLRARLERPGYVRLFKRPVADEEAVAALDRLARAGLLPGVALEPTAVRRYPEGRLAAHVLGFLGADGRGQAGVERALDAYLRGRGFSRRSFLRDARSRRLFDASSPPVEAEAGGDVRLTLDVAIQYFAEEALDRIMEQHDPDWATIVVLDPREGDVLAMASRPGFDPNRYGSYPVAHFVNRAVSAQYTPGSTFKPFFMALVLESGAARLEETLDCSSFIYRGRRVRDAHPNGRLTVPGVVVHSSNIGMSQLALRLVPGDDYPEEVRRAAYRRIRDRLVALGFGRTTGIGLPAEEDGLLRPVGEWSTKYTLISLSFGHEIAVTPIQLAAAFAVFATGGIYRAPRLVTAVERPDGTVAATPPRPPRRVFEPDTALAVRSMLERVVAEGTGRRAAVRGHRVAGKTSTAQWENDPSHYTASFAGFAPARDPRLLVLVVVDRPRGRFHTGGRVAAPAAGEVLGRALAYLRVPAETGQ